MIRVLFAVVAVPALACCAHAAEPSAAAAARPLPDALRSFFATHCTSCHNNDSPTAKLSLESRPADFDNPAWVRIHDRIAAGEMPPAGEAQPDPARKAEVVGQLAQELTKGAQRRQQSEGRVLFRRMNRREYETTLHDLLGIAIPLQAMLPEDNPVHGFDTVSGGLETSSTHLLRYQQAADAAIAEALPAWPITNDVRRLTGRAFLDSRPKPNREGTAPFVRFEGETLVLCATLYKHGSIYTPHTPVAGRYRIRASVRAVNNGGKPIPVMIGKISSDRFAHEKLEHLLDIQDAPADRARVIELTTTLPRSEQVYLEGIGLPFFQNFKKERNGEPVGDDFAGPGLAVDWIEIEGPLDAGIGYSRLFGDLPPVPSRYLDDTLSGKPVKDDWKKWPVPGEFQKYPLTPVSRDPKADAERLIRAFLPRAFRRPPTDEQVKHYVEIAHDLLARGERFDEAMRDTYKAILCSPYFLYYVERPGPLDDHAVAARLARFLWNSLPDDELTAVAAAGRLRDPDVLRAQTERLLRDPKAARFCRTFVDQWLDLGKFFDMKPDDVYIEYDDMLAWSMPQETRRYFDEVLARDLPTTSFWHGDWSFLNARLARHYRIPGVEGLELRRVALPPESHRGGVITQASVLKLTTNASYTSPIKRGAWLLERVVGKPPPPPPPDVKAVEPDIRGATTIREQLQKHKEVTVCATCHAHIDPPGFALENFDVIGGWRDRYRVKQGGIPGNDYVDLRDMPGRKVWLAKPVEAHGVTADGKDFQNIDDYKRLRLGDADQFTRNLAEKLVVYATGAPIDFADRATVEQIVRDVGSRNHGFRTLVHAVIQSAPFLQK